MNKQQSVSRNEEQFIVSTLRTHPQDTVRIDGRTAFDMRSIDFRFRTIPNNYLFPTNLNKFQQMEQISSTPPLQQQQQISPLQQQWNVSSVNSQVEVTLGATRVSASTSCTLAEPYAERPTEGLLSFHVQFAPTSGQRVARDALSGKRARSEREMELARLLDRVLRGSRAVDTEALCVVAGKRVWNVRVEVCVLDDCGNAVDAAYLAALASVLHCRRPDVSVGEGGSFTVHPLDQREAVPLTVHHVPICVSFGFVKLLESGVSYMEGDSGSNVDHVESGGSNVDHVESECAIIVDPLLKEELVMHGSMTVAMNVQDEICAIQKGGGMPLSVEQIVKCTKIAKVKAHEIYDLLKAALKRDEEERQKMRLPQYERVKPMVSSEQQTPVDLDQDEQMLLNATSSLDEENYEEQQTQQLVITKKKEAAIVELVDKRTIKNQGITRSGSTKSPSTKNAVPASFAVAEPVVSPTVVTAVSAQHIDLEETQDIEEEEPSIVVPPPVQPVLTQKPVQIPQQVIAKEAAKRKDTKKDVKKKIADLTGAIKKKK